MPRRQNGRGPRAGVCGKCNIRPAGLCIECGRLLAQAAAAAAGAEFDVRMVREALAREAEAAAAGVRACAGALLERVALLRSERAVEDAVAGAILGAAHAGRARGQKEGLGRASELVCPGCRRRLPYAEKTGEEEGAEVYHLDPEAKPADPTTGTGLTRCRAAAIVREVLRVG